MISLYIYVGKSVIFHRCLEYISDTFTVKNFTVKKQKQKKNSKILAAGRPEFYCFTMQLPLFSILLFFWITVYDCRITVGAVVILQHIYRNLSNSIIPFFGLQYMMVG